MRCVVFGRGDYRWLLLACCRWCLSLMRALLGTIGVVAAAAVAGAEAATWVERDIMAKAAMDTAVMAMAADTRDMHLRRPIMAERMVAAARMRPPA